MLGRAGVWSEESREMWLRWCHESGVRAAGSGEDRCSGMCVRAVCVAVVRLAEIRVSVWFCKVLC